LTRGSAFAFSSLQSMHGSGRRAEAIEAIEGFGYAAIAEEYALRIEEVDPLLIEDPRKGFDSLRPLSAVRPRSIVREIPEEGRLERDPVHELLVVHVPDDQGRRDDAHEEDSVEEEGPEPEAS
jgi:hypothetical protein